MALYIRWPGKLSVMKIVIMAFICIVVVVEDDLPLE